MEDILAQELKYYGFRGRKAEIIQNKEGVTVARIVGQGGSCILKYFENTAFRREIVNYDILRSYGIPTLAVLGKNRQSILLEDLGASPRWRLARREDLDDERVVKAIARWYKALHEKGADYVKQSGAGMYDEHDCFTLDNLTAIQEAYHSPGVVLLLEHYDFLKGRLDPLPRTLAYNDFYYTNLAVSRRQSEALMFDYNLLGKGTAACDIMNVTYWFSAKNKAVFLAEYGERDANLFILEELCAPIISLYSAMARGIFPNWAKEALEILEDIPALDRKIKALR